MRTQLAMLADRAFDVVVIGAGINGCAAAQELSAAGYATLLVDKADFASAASSASTRLIHCGLRYLAPGGSPLDLILAPRKLATALSMARKAMQARSEFVGYAAERARKFTFGYALWRGMRYRPWQVDLALRVLEGLGPGDLPLERARIAPAAASEHPLFRHLRDQRQLLGVMTFSEYQFDWPERIAIDMVLDAERMGAVCRNYTSVRGLRRGGDGRWALTLDDAFVPGVSVTVIAHQVINAAGIWIDRINRLATSAAPRKVFGTKGVHIVLRLPPECEGYGVIGVNRAGDEPVYLVPWRPGLHYMGVTETVFEGDEDEVRADEDDIQWLLDEFNHLVPALAKKRADVLYSWVGVRPLTNDPAFSKGARSRRIHDLAADGMPGVLAITAGPITTHRSAGRELRDIVARRIAPSRAPQSPDYTPVALGADKDSPTVLNDYDGVRVADLRRAAEREQVCCLTDLLARRTGLVWSATNAREAAQHAAGGVADILGWDEARVAREVADYLAYLARRHTRSTA